MERLVDFIKGCKPGMEVVIICCAMQIKAFSGKGLSADDPPDYHGFEGNKYFVDDRFWKGGRTSTLALQMILLELREDHGVPVPVPFVESHPEPQDWYLFKAMRFRPNRGEWVQVTSSQKGKVEIHFQSQWRYDYDCHLPMMGNAYDNQGIVRIEILL